MFVEPLFRLCLISIYFVDCFDRVIAASWSYHVAFVTLDNREGHYVYTYALYNFVSVLEHDCVNNSQSNAVKQNMKRCVFPQVDDTK